MAVSNGLELTRVGLNPSDVTAGGLWSNSLLIGEGEAENLPPSDWHALIKIASNIGQAIRFITVSNPF
jgi:hypothetical protein